MIYFIVDTQIVTLINHKQKRSIESFSEHKSNVIRSKSRYNTIVKVEQLN